MVVVVVVVVVVRELKLWTHAFQWERSSAQTGVRDIQCEQFHWNTRL